MSRDDRAGSGAPPRPPSQSARRPAPRRRPRPAPSAAASPLPARAAAAALLARTLDERLFFDAAAEREKARLDALTPGDRTLARRLALTALRRLGEIDAEIDARLAKPLPRRAGPIRHALRVAAAETVFLDGPAHAAVDAAVRLAKQTDARLGGLVNAVSRRIAESGPRLADRPRREAGRLNAPPWLWERLVADWGEAAAGAIAAGHLAPAPLDLTPRSDAQTWAERLGATLTPGGGLRLAGGDGALTEKPGFAEGAWWVQDAAAATPARLFGPLDGRRALDLCAAPGGKTMQLAAAGAKTTALDLSEARLRRLRENLARTGLSAEIVAADALTWGPDAIYDAVLLDAPCSASGTLRRHPELAWIKDGDGLAALAATQDALLDAAWAMVAPGGRLVYGVCSLFKIEGEARAEAFLARQGDAAPAPAPAEAAAPELLDPARRFRSLPSHWSERGGIDGFFAASFDKRAP